MYHPAFAPATEDGERQIESKSFNSRPVASTLSERIELLDVETRSCWRHVDEMEDEEASLNHRLAGLEKIRRGERMKILGIEQACKVAEMAMLKAQEETVNLETKLQALDNLAQDAAEDPLDSTTNSDGHRGFVSNGGNSYASSRVEGSAALAIALRKIPSHIERRGRLTSLLQQTENQTRSEIAEAARSAAELRRSAKKRNAESLPLERETSALRGEVAAMAGGTEINNRVVRGKQISEGLKRRLLHANNKLASERETLSQGPARHLEKEEQRSLELMQGIAEVKLQLRSDDGTDARPSGTPGGPNRRERRTMASGPKLQLQPSRGMSRNGQQHDQSQLAPSSRKSWGEWA